MAETLIGSEIIKLAGEINQKIQQGAKIYNFTIGDFDPKVFPIPTALEEAILEAYRDGHTNYPAANGVLELRKAVAKFVLERQGLDYSADQYLIGGGARPMIYGLFATLLDPGDKVVFPVPSWNNNHYTHLMRCEQVFVETTPEGNFMPTAEMLRPHLKGATLLALCSPLNPTGTVFTPEALAEICDMVLEENRSRAAGEKPLYVMYDQIYWALTFGEIKHCCPVTLRPEMRPYTVYVDGISKLFAATGVRVGWAVGPMHIIDKMKSILSHIGAWSPKAEQVATANFFNNVQAVDDYLDSFKKAVEWRLNGMYEGFMRLKAEGHSVDAITPQAAIYLTVKLDLVGKTTADGRVLDDMKAVTAYILDEAGMAIVPFYAFGASVDSPWYRLSVGTCKESDVAEAIEKLGGALRQLSVTSNQ